MFICSKSFSQPEKVIQVGVTRQIKFLLLVLYNIVHEKDSPASSIDYNTLWPLLLNFHGRFMCPVPLV